jgi:two-component system, LytTR family, response regulator
VPWATQLGEAVDGATALAEIAHLRPDLVFLDIRMPELSGLEVVECMRELDKIPAVIFTTAFDQYAVTAFELEAMDYLLKPFGRSRFQVAIDRVRLTLENQRPFELLDRARSVLAKSAAPGPLDRILVRQGAAVVPLAPAEISRIEAQDDYAMVHARGRGFLIGVRLRDLEARLPQPPFLRVHRSHIVNLDEVDRMVRQDDGRFAVRMKDGACIQASRARSQEIQRQSR